MRIEIIVGTGFSADGIALTANTVSSAREIFEDYVCEIFGGFTRFDVVGGWRDEKGRVVKEPGLCYLIFAEWGTPMEKVQGTAASAARAFCQACVVLTIDGGPARYIGA